MNTFSKGSRSALAAALLLAATALAQAQTPDPKGCTPQERSNQALNQGSDKNAGVICPPDIDATMKVPTPKTGDTSVILPPGSSGVDPNVQPK
jgi:hypothetical protein